MRGRVFGYARVSARRRVPDWPAQRELIAGYCAWRGWAFEADRQFFADGQNVRGLMDRPAGGALFRCIQRGDRVVTPSLDRAFASGADCGATFTVWNNLGIELHVVNLGGPLDQLDLPAVAAAMAALEKAARSETAAVSGAHSRHAGRPVNGCSPYGFEWVRRRGGEWELVRDETERALMGKLLEWSEQGHSIDQIRQHLQYSAKFEFYKRRGRQKRLVRSNSDAIWRRIQAERRLREQESEAVNASMAL